MMDTKVDPVMWLGGILSIHTLLASIAVHHLSASVWKPIMAMYIHLIYLPVFSWVSSFLNVNWGEWQHHIHFQTLLMHVFSSACGVLEQVWNLNIAYWQSPLINAWIPCLDKINTFLIYEVLCSSPDIIHFVLWILGWVIVASHKMLATCHIFMLHHAQKWELLGVENLAWVTQFPGWHKFLLIILIN